MSDFNDDQNCFVCGRENAAGLKLAFRKDESSHGVETDVSFPGYLQGWKETVHGGLLATVLDETMVKAAEALGIKCVTAEITVRYRKPASTGVSYLVSGKVLETRGRIFTAESRIHDGSGQIYAQATGKFFRIK